MPVYEIPKGLRRPAVACNPEELENLRRAWRGTGPAAELIAACVARAQSRLGRPLDIPPVGAESRAWYTCKDCAVLLVRQADRRSHRCPKCGRVYRDEFLDRVGYIDDHGANLVAAEDAAWAWAVTGEIRYAEYARDMLLAYADRYRVFPLHDWERHDAAHLRETAAHIFSSTLEEFMYLSRHIAPALDLIADSPCVSAAQRAHIENDLLAGIVDTLPRWRGDISNWQSWHDAGLIAAGVVAGRADWVNRALNEQNAGFFEQMEKSVSAEGVWYENSWAYHWFTIMALVLVAETARRIGIDLWDHPVFRKMLEAPLVYRMPDGSLPRLGDSTTGFQFGGDMSECAYHAWGDPLAAEFLPKDESPTWQTVLLGRAERPVVRTVAPPSRAMPSAGHVILRSGGAQGLAALMTFSQPGGVHGHFDKLSFILYGRGREIAVDPGKASTYALPMHQRWARGTIAHNTVVVDGRCAAPAQGSLELFADADGWAAASAVCTEAYAGVQHRRLLVLSPRYLLVVDRLAATDGRSRRFDWCYHHLAADIQCDAPLAAAAAPAGHDGAEFMQNVHAGATDEPIRFAFAGEGLCDQAVASPAAGTGVMTAQGPGPECRFLCPMFMLTRSGAAANFAVIIEPAADASGHQVARVECSAAGDALTVTVTARDGRPDRIVWTPGAAAVTHDGREILRASPQ